MSHTRIALCSYVTAVSLDLTLTPLYRINGQESASVPGLLAIMPPRKTARGREQDRLVVYLLLTGNATFSTAEYTQLAEARSDSVLSKRRPADFGHARGGGGHQ